jgi:hypothetical protein
MPPKLYGLNALNNCNLTSLQSSRRTTRAFSRPSNGKEDFVGVPNTPLCPNTSARGANRKDFPSFHCGLPSKLVQAVLLEELVRRFLPEATANLEKENRAS